jgi:hypothetical protein
MLTSPVDPALYVYVRAVFTSIYLLWAALWGVVCYHYGKSSYVSWKVADGRWRNVVGDVLQPFWWAIKESMCRWKLTRGASFCGNAIPNPYNPGNLLQFAIFMSSLTPIAFGLQFSDLDRSTWSWFHLAVTAAFATMSILAAGGHLFLAYRNYPNSWRKLVMRSLAWCVFAPPVFLFIYEIFPSGL